LSEEAVELKGLELLLLSLLLVDQGNLIVILTFKSWSVNLHKLLTLLLSNHLHPTVQSPVLENDSVNYFNRILIKTLSPKSSTAHPQLRTPLHGHDF
jgi:hypothetical protein